MKQPDSSLLPLRDKLALFVIDAIRRNVWSKEAGLMYADRIIEMVTEQPKDTSSELHRGVDFEIDENGTPRQIGARLPSRERAEQSENDDKDALLCEHCGHWYDSSKGPCPDCFGKPGSVTRDPLTEGWPLKRNSQAQDAVFSGRFGTVDGLALARARDALIQIVRLCEEDERCNADCFADIAKAAHTALTVTE